MRASRAPAYARLRLQPSYGASAEAFGEGGNGAGIQGPPRVSASVGGADYGVISPKLREGGSA